jgi:hypothetical protein
MSKKPVLMIHEVREWMFDLPLENYVLTFDDGLYSQFYHFDRFKSIQTEKIFFISTDIVSSGTQSLDFPTCREAHQKYRKGNREDYMTLPQIRELMKDPLTTIGAHSHTHTQLDKLSLQEAYQHIRLDTERMIDWFNLNLKYHPTKFCYPYNNDWHGLYKKLLSYYGFTDFYGKERTAIEDFEPWFKILRFNPCDKLT